MKHKLLIFILLLALVFVPLQSARAQSPSGDIVRFGENYTLESGETLNGSIVVFGGNVTIEKEAQVNGDIIVFGGNILLEGEISGSVVIFGGNVTVYENAGGDIVLFGSQALLKENAVVKGNVVTIGGQVTEETGAKIEGDKVDNLTPPEPPSVPQIPNVPNVPDVPNTPDVEVNINPLWEVMGVIWRALALAAIAMLLALFLQPQMDRVSNTIIAQPMLAGSFGLLTVILTPLAILLMVVTLILIPVAFLVVLILPIVWMFGIIALGQEVGERFTKAINQTWAPVLSTGFGTFMLMIVLGFVGLIPCLGWLASFIVSLIALGGVMMTWFGSRATPGNPTPPVEVIEVPPAS